MLQGSSFNLPYDYICKAICKAIYARLKRSTARLSCSYSTARHVLDKLDSSTATRQLDRTRKNSTELDRTRQNSTLRRMESASTGSTGTRQELDRHQARQARPRQPLDSASGRRARGASPRRTAQQSRRQLSTARAARHEDRRIVAGFTSDAMYFVGRRRSISEHDALGSGYDCANTD